MSIQAFVLGEAVLVAAVLAVAARTHTIKTQPQVVAIPVKVRDNQ